MADQTPEQVAAAEAAAAASQKAMAEIVQGAVKTSIEGMVKESQAKAAELEAQKAAEAAATQRGATTPLDEVFRPVLDPVLRESHEAITRANLAADSVNFYTDPANADAIEYRSQIEKIVVDQAKKGNAVARMDAWKYLRGGDLYPELTKKALTAHEQKLKEAREAAAVGPSTTVPKFTKPIEAMATDELGEALKGVAF